MVSHLFFIINQIRAQEFSSSESIIINNKEANIIIGRIFMTLKIYNLYNNQPLPQTDFIGDHGSSYLLQTDSANIMFDVGTKSDILFHNMKLLKISPKIMTHLIFSHGHYDHTKAFPDFLDEREKDSKLPIYAHPGIQEKKFIKLGPFRKSISFPSLTTDQQQKIDYHFSKESQEIIPNFKTTGEIKERPYKQGIEKRAYHEVNDTIEVDPVWEDNSLVIKAKPGLVILMGCAHAGILNICKFVKDHYTEKIDTIIGGSHMVRYTKSEVIDTGNQLKTEFDYPDLFLNHCTDQLPLSFLKTTPTLEILRESYGNEKINKFFAGSQLTFPL